MTKLGRRRAVVLPMVDEMAPTVGRLHLSAFEGYMNTLIGSGYIEAFLRWFCHASDAVALVAVDPDDRVIGYVVGAAEGYGPSMNRDLVWVAARGMIQRPWLILDHRIRKVVAGRTRLLIGRRVQAEAPLGLPEPVFSLVGIGVSPQAQGQGIGAELLTAFEQAARARGAASMLLSVYPTNEGARRLYTRRGWKPVTQSERSDVAMCYSKIL